jgi:hypothetical protein
MGNAASKLDLLGTWEMTAPFGDDDARIERAWITVTDTGTCPVGAFIRRGSWKVTFDGPAVCRLEVDGTIRIALGGIEPHATLDLKSGHLVLTNDGSISPWPDEEISFRSAPHLSLCPAGPDCYIGATD